MSENGSATGATTLVASQGARLARQRVEIATLHKALRQAARHSDTLGEGWQAATRETERLESQLEACRGAVTSLRQQQEAHTDQVVGLQLRIAELRARVDEA